MTINLTKPAIEHNSQERQELLAKLIRDVRATLVPNCGRLSGQQIAYAKGRAWKLMKEAGF